MEELNVKIKIIPGQEVWVVNGRNANREVRKEMVLAVICEITNLSQSPLCLGYRLPLLNMEVWDGSWPPSEVYEEEKDALAAAEWFPVISISPQEWLVAIGDRDGPSGIEDCELSRLDERIAEARTILIRCKENEGLLQRDVRRLVALLSEGWYPLPMGRRPPVLDRIMEELGVLEEVCPKSYSAH